MTTIVGGICPRCGQFHDLFLAVDGSIVCRNADGTAERIRQLEAERDAARGDVENLRTLVRIRSEERDAARAEVAALRESIARDIEAAWQDQCDDWRVPERCESCRAYDLAVRIARGEP